MFQRGVWVCVSVCISVTAARAQPALDKAPFSASPKELLAVAQAVPASDHAIVILREEEDAAFESDGRRRYRMRRVFVVRSQAGVDDWGTVSASWSPFYQERPVLRARVIDPAGTVSELDPKLVTDSPTHSTSATVFSDSRRLEAPLPRLKIGAIVEEELAIIDRLPILTGAGMHTTTLGDAVPVQSTRLVFSAPVNKGRFHAIAIPGNVKPKHAVKGDRETWTVELGALSPRDDVEYHVPRDVPAWGGIVGITMTSWAIVAREYKKLLDKRIADGPLAYPDKLPKAPTIETVRALVSWLHANIRYTGIEFDEASNIPWTPAETAKRGFGDCKDKATLLIALLRQAGIRADLALLSTGPGFDTMKELPGMDMFDHAIVRARVGNKDVWIDATEDLLLPGQLPVRDQMRRSLVIADDTTALVDTPGPAPGDNTIKETRTFALAEQGNARVTEVSVEGGVFGAAQRDWIRSGKASDVQKALADYADSEYRGKLVRYTTTAVEDLATPLAITAEFEGSARAYTDRGKIDVYLFPSDTFAKLPAATREQSKQPRRHDFVWSSPHVYEIENRLVLPTGYTMPTPAAERVHALGPAKLVERQRVDGNALIITFRLETGKQQISPAELAALQKAVVGVQESVHVVIEHTGTALVGRGKWREGIAEIQRLIALHPKEALHHAELASALQQAGMGTAARRAAKKAIEVEPTNADAHAVLRQDSLGRDDGYDYDRAGAISAYRKARKLDPTHVGAAVDLADVLQRDTSGALYGATADLPGAVEAWRAAHALEETDEHAFALARVLMATKKHTEADALLRKRPAGEVRDGLLVAAIAGGSGAKEAIDAATRMHAGPTRANVLRNAVFVLMVLRDYDRARPLMAELNVAPGSAQERLMRDIKRHDPAAISPKDPRAPLADLYGMVINRAYVPRFTWDAMTFDEQATPIKDQAIAALRGVSPSFLEDALFSLTQTIVEGTGPWRVELDIMGKAATYYAALDKGVAKVFGAGDKPYGVGRHLFRLLAAKQDAKASQLVGWVAKDSPNAPIAMLWQPKIPTDRPTLELVAALMAGPTSPREAAPILQRCATTAPGMREHCDRQLALVLGSENKWKDLEQHTAEWLARKSDSLLAQGMRIYALQRVNRHDEADKLFAGLQSNDPVLVSAHAEVATSRGAFDEALRRLEPLVKANDESAMNQVAWLSVVAEKDLQRGAELAAKAIGPDKTKGSDAILNTLGTIEAELGLLRAARDDGWQAMANRTRDVPEPQDWYIVGRIAEQLGLRDDAIAAYRKCPPDPRNPRLSVHGLAQRRLQRMGAK
jgi:tetratricopeptide (TPR) repeat protein